MWLPDKKPWLASIPGVGLSALVAVFLAVHLRIAYLGWQGPGESLQELAVGLLLLAVAAGNVVLLPLQLLVPGRVRLAWCAINLLAVAGIVATQLAVPEKVPALFMIGAFGSSAAVLAYTPSCATRG